MHPRIFTTPFFTLHSFGLLLALAFLAAMWWVMRGARREGLKPDLLTGLGLWAIVGGIISAKLLPGRRQ
jgi:phosphatidylglycerol:prolipoprotein diacylglycerol transferase